jgi:hypothetical protein
MPSSPLVKTKRTKLGQHKPTQSYFCFESCPITFSKLGTFQHTTGIRVVDLRAREEFSERFTIRFLSCHLSALVCLYYSQAGLSKTHFAYFCLRTNPELWLKLCWTLTCTDRIGLHCGFLDCDIIQSCKCIKRCHNLQGQVQNLSHRPPCHLASVKSGRISQ